jgi:tetratricopeptide (TPR) repeat protein
MPVMSQDASIVKKNNSAVGKIGEEKFLEAYTYLVDGIMEDGDVAEMHYNLGIVFEGMKDEEKAVLEYEASVERTEDKDLSFRAHFNAGRVFGAQARIDEALEHYQKALDLKPDSVETKANIELLLKKEQGGGKSQQEKNENGKGKSESQEKENEGKERRKELQPNKPQKYKGKNISAKDVKKILEELKRQEEKIRGKVLNKDSQEEESVEKDW